MEGFIGEVKYFAGTYAPKNWAFCEGQQLPIVQYTPLYSLIGTTYGGDGKNYFNLPDFRGRMALGPGQSSGTSTRKPGELGGYQSIQLTTVEMPGHNHNVKCDMNTGGRTIQPTPINNLFGKTNLGKKYAAGTNNQLMKDDMINTEGQSGAHENMSPWLCMPMIICLYGYYPIRP
jgi:microcystin-dependent protein